MLRFMVSPSSIQDPLGIIFMSLLMCFCTLLSSSTGLQLHVSLEFTIYGASYICWALYLCSLFHPKHIFFQVHFY